MAVILYLAGNRRLITKHSHIFLHEIGTNYDKETKVKISDIDKKHNYLNYQKRKYIDIIYNTTQGKLAKPTIEKMMLEETYLLPKEAKKYGLAHEIID